MLEDKLIFKTGNKLETLRIGFHNDIYVCLG